MDQELKELEAYLEAGKTEEARGALQRLLSRPLSKEEQGGVFVGIAAAYLKVMNGIQADYLAALDEAAEGLEELEKERTARMDLIRKGETRRRLDA